MLQVKRLTLLVALVVGILSATAFAADVKGLFQSVLHLRLELQALEGAQKSAETVLSAKTLKWSLDARILEANHRLFEMIRRDPSLIRDNLSRIEGLSANEQAGFIPLLRELAQEETFRNAQIEVAKTNSLKRAFHPSTFDECYPTVGTSAQALLKKILQKQNSVSSPRVNRAFSHGDIQPVTSMATKAPPRIGTIKGTVNGAPISLTFDRREWTIVGTIGQKPVQLKIDHDKGFISGTVSVIPVQLNYDWSPEVINLTGTSFQGFLQMRADWQAKTLSGMLNQSAIRVQFDVEAGKVSGAYGQSPVSLIFHNVSGALDGMIGSGLVNLRLENLDLYDFLTHFYLFVK